MRTICVVLFLTLASCTAEINGQSVEPAEIDSLTENFSGERAYVLVEEQIEFGPRTPGSAGHRLIGTWIEEQLQGHGWSVEIQEFNYGGYQLKNIIARTSDRFAVSTPIILGAHYDTRIWADKDLVAPEEPVPGANDGASGVAVLLELARVLDQANLHQPVWLVFFDAEDNGRIAGWDWILGSRYFVDHLKVEPSAAVIVDMVGDADLSLYFERNSDPAIRSSIWQTGVGLGYGEFIMEEKYSILDDHTPFLQAGIPAVDIIDFDYPYYHTTEDLPDKVSPRSLEVVGRTLETWLELPD